MSTRIPTGRSLPGELVPGNYNPDFKSRYVEAIFSTSVKGLAIRGRYVHGIVHPWAGFPIKLGKRVWMAREIFDAVLAAPCGAQIHATIIRETNAVPQP